VTPADQFDWLTRNAVQVYTEEALRQRLAENRPLRVKLGVDPTAPDIHLGHTVVLTKLREFQELGHHAVLIIGDFTARIGDPSGRSVTRPQLTREAITANAATYLEQVGKILDGSQLEIRYNSEWFAAFTFEDVIRLAARLTLARTLERDDFQQRYRAGAPIGIHELLYPLMQGWDSVVVRADVELGGTDQTFNLLVGRDLQREAGVAGGQVALVMPLLEGIDGTQKMSKSLGNQIGVSEPPAEMYGKVMSISDRLMSRYFELLSLNQEAGRTASAVHPMTAKKLLARELVSRFHSEADAESAARFFQERFQQRATNDPTPFTLISESPTVWICQLLRQIGFARSSSDARRLVAQGAVRVEDRPVDLEFQLQRGATYLVGVGRRRLASVSILPPPVE
jgi:tyrosyl-tRNA synthetase